MKKFILILIFLLSCSREESNFNLQSLEGVDLEGKTFQFNAITKMQRMALNVYSPTCVPCVKEIPVLNYLRKEMINKNLGEFYMIVDPYTLVDEDIKDINEAIQKASEIMKKEIQEKKIEMPVIIMKPPFKVLPGEGLVTGTPETLLLKTNPLVLYYNFIGAISQESDLEKIKSDKKIDFFIQLVGGAI